MLKQQGQRIFSNFFWIMCMVSDVSLFFCSFFNTIYTAQLKLSISGNKLNLRLSLETNSKKESTKIDKSHFYSIDFFQTLPKKQK